MPWSIGRDLRSRVERLPCPSLAAAHAHDYAAIISNANKPPSHPPRNCTRPELASELTPAILVSRSSS